MSTRLTLTVNVRLKHRLASGGKLHLESVPILRIHSNLSVWRYVFKFRLKGERKRISDAKRHLCVVAEST